jgi:hypothetical protein
MEAPKAVVKKYTTQAEMDAAKGITPEQRAVMLEKGRKQAEIGEAQRTVRRKKALGK